MRNKKHWKALHYNRKKKDGRKIRTMDIRLATVETSNTLVLPWKSLELLLPAPAKVPATNSSLVPEVVTGLPLLEKRLF